jgi:hypothetical protein
MDRDDILPEYDFSRAQPNKFASHRSQSCHVEVIERDVADLVRSRATEQVILDNLDEPRRNNVWPTDLGREN